MHSRNLSVLFIRKIGQFLNPPPPLERDVIYEWSLRRNCSANDCRERAPGLAKIARTTRRNRNENDLLLSGSNGSVERSWRRQVDAATARVVARQGSFGAENLDAKGNVEHMWLGEGGHT